MSVIVSCPLLRPHFLHSGRRLFVFLLLSSLIAGEVWAQTTPVKRPKRKGTRYTVRINSAPEQVAIYLDDEKYGVVGYTPYKGRLQKGAWKLILKREGFVTKTMDINVRWRSRKFFAVMDKEVLPAVVKISAVSDPNIASASVSLDGKQVGKVPLSLKVPAGRHQVSIQKDGFEPLSRWVELKAGETIQLAPALKRRAKLAGSLLVDANRPSAQVWIDGKQQAGETPIVIDALSPGNHVVEVRSSGAPAWKQVVEVKSGQRVKVRAILVLPKKVVPGSLFVDADVRGAEVKIDGKLLSDKTPTVVDELAAGPHDLQVLKPPHAPWITKVTVRSGERVKVVAPLLAQTEAAKLRAKEAVAAAKRKADEAARAAKLKAGVGTVRVLCSVAKAEVLLDGKTIGHSPAKITQALDIKFIPAGLHTVSAKASGERVAIAQVEVKKDAMVKVSLRLAVLSKAEEAGGEAAAKKAALAPTVDADKVAWSKEAVAVNRAALAAVSGPKGRLKVNALVRDSRVKVDGKPMGNAPLELKLPVGEHVILVVASGTLPFTQRARIAADRLTTVVAQLKQKPPSTNNQNTGKGGESAGKKKAPLGQKDAPKGVVKVSPSSSTKPQPVSVAPKAPLPLEEPYDPSMLMISTFGARPLPSGEIAVDVGAGYPYWGHARVTVGMVNDAHQALDGSLSYRTGVKTHELLLGARYRLLGKGPGIVSTFATVGGGGGAGGINNFTLQGGGMASLVFGEAVALSARVMVDAWSDRLCRELKSGETVGSDAPAGCVTDKTDKRYSQAAQDMLSGGAKVRDLGLRLLVGLTLEVSLSTNANLFVQGDVPLVGRENRAAFSSRFNDWMLSVDDPGWLARAGLTFKL